MIKRLREIVRQPLDESDLLLCAGAEAIVVGLSFIYPPLAYLFTGSLFIYIANLHGKREAMQARNI